VGVFLLLLVCFTHQLAYGQSQQTQRYTYDQAGNLISIGTAETNLPPQVSSIQPPLALTGRTRQFIAAGSDLLNAVVTSARADVQVVTMQTELDSITFSLQVASDASLADIPLSFATPLGLDTINLPVLPPVSASPIPVVLAVTQSLPLRLRSEREVAQDTEYQLIISNPAIASTVSSIVIPAGQLAPVADPDITALALGSTTVSLRFNNFELLSFSIQVVPGLFVPDDGDAFASAPIGLLKESAPGVLNLGPFVSSIGIEKLTLPTPIDVSLTANQTSLLVGSGVSGVVPDRIMRGSSNQIMSVSGYGLQTVDQIEINPAESVAVTLTDAAADGRSVTVTVNVDDDAETGLRGITLLAGGTAVPVITPGSNLFDITGDVPVIDSISPILVPPFTQQTLLVRGQNFGEQPLLSIVPADSIDLDASPQILNDGSVLQANMLIAADALPGPRVIVVTTAAGDTGLVSVPANTLTVTANDQLIEFTPLASPLLGISKGMPSMAGSALLHAPLLGVSRGQAITGLSPGQAEVGQSVLLELTGTALSAVDELLIQPDDGLTTGPLQIEDNRLSINVDVAVAAPQIPRRVIARQSGIALPAAHGADILQIVPPAPSVLAMTPNFVVADGQPQQISVTGEFLQNTQSVRVTPADKVLIGNLQVVDANTLSMMVTADATAGLGDRLMQVITDTGTSSATLQPNNTLRVVLPEQIVPDVVAPVLGVVVASQPQSQSVDVNSSLLSIAKAPVVTTVSPTLLLRGTSTLIEINGAGMEVVDEVLVLPGTDISSSALNVAAGGDVVSFMLAVDDVAEPGLRTLQLLAGGQPLPYATPHISLIRIADEQPVIASITPNSGFPGAQFTMIVRGQNLLKASAVMATPDSGFSFDSAPVVNVDGTEITINVTLAADATAGSRLIQVQTPSGSSSSQATPANTFNILEP